MLKEIINIIYLNSYPKCVHESFYLKALIESRVPEITGYLNFNTWLENDARNIERNYLQWNSDRVTFTSGEILGGAHSRMMSLGGTKCWRWDEIEVMTSGYSIWLKSHRAKWL